MNARNTAHVSALGATRIIAPAMLLMLFVVGCGRSADDAAPPPDTEQIQVEGVTTIAPTTIPTQVTYVVQAGESLSIIASRFGVGVRELADFNAIADVDSVKVGQLLSIPPTTATTAIVVPDASSTTS